LTKPINPKKRIIIKIKGKIMEKTLQTTTKRQHGAIRVQNNKTFLDAYGFIRKFHLRSKKDLCILFSNIIGDPTEELNMTRALDKALQDAKTALKGQIEALKADIRLIDEMIERQHTDEAAQASFIDDASLDTVKMTPTYVAKELFTQFPNRRWTAPQIRDVFEEKKKKGELDSTSAQLLYSANDTCNRLAKQGFIEKKKVGKKVWYIKKTE